MCALRVGFIGVGNMGMAMAKPIARSGLQLTAFDLNEKALEEIKAAGGKVAANCRELAGNSDAVITMVRNTGQTDEVLFGEDGAIEGLEAGNTIIVSSSIGPEYCRDLYAKMKPKGIRVIDCAVSDPSGVLHETDGGLTLMIGGDKDAVDNCMPIFEVMGKKENIFYLGEIGMGQTYKIINNLAAFNLGTLNREIMNLGVAAGLDLEKMIEVMTVSTGGSWSLWFIGAMMKARKEQAASGRPAPQGPPPQPRQPGQKPALPLEKRLAMELAEKLGVDMPLGNFIDNVLDPAGYTHYLKRMAEG
ncbi:MAG: NAD(P)-dependent oxidoreductase [Dehalococcoidales bacterium]|nr:NAD(P)-dependent oxidoreductase [Dehalococcoidales bacterium]